VRSVIERFTGGLKPAPTPQDTPVPGPSDTPSDNDQGKSN
jgi:hypothetical protein